LEIRIRQQGVEHTVSITMRTPGNDPELAAGFLFTEGILHARRQIALVDRPANNVIVVEIAGGEELDLKPLNRNFYLTSSCGVCGKASIEALHVNGCERMLAGEPFLTPELIHKLPEIARERQSTFDRTGGLHAAALFDKAGTLCDLREDVGRHNAVDKMIGGAFLAGETPLLDRILLVSGRTSFELVQKTVVARIPVLAAVGAPSSLAVELAGRFNLTLLGFVRNKRFNIYTGASRFKEKP
jgi:FdhD protein